MILIRGKRVDEILEVLDNGPEVKRNHRWLATQLNIGESYISRIMHNRVQISKHIIETLPNLLNTTFEDLFLVIQMDDNRRFYGKDSYCIEEFGPLLTEKEYDKCIEELFEKNNKKKT